MNNFKLLQQFVNDMRSTSSSKEKKHILNNYRHEDFIRKCLQYVNDPYKTFGVTSKSIKKYIASSTEDYSHIGYYSDLFRLLQDLSDRKITGHDAIREILYFTHINCEAEALIYQIIDKNLEIRANAKLINSVILGLIPVFDVALAESYEERLVNFETEEWYASRKMDGLRCICRIDASGDAKFFSRAGIEFFTLDVLKGVVKKSQIRSIVLDGEICVMNGILEDFKGILKEYNRKNHTIKNPKYFIFDCLSLKEFDLGYSNICLQRRWLRLDLHMIAQRIPHFAVLEQRLIHSDEDVHIVLEQAVAKGHEGLIIRKNVDYKGKRSNDILKVKNFMEAEYTVVGVENNIMRFIEDGKDVPRETLGAVVIEHKGNAVSVGSGFSKQERALYYKQPEKIIGTIITVRYFKETTNSKNDLFSLSFPSVKAIHGKERVV